MMASLPIRLTNLFSKKQFYYDEEKTRTRLCFTTKATCMVRDIVKWMSSYRNQKRVHSRGIDFLIRKIFRSLDAYEFENQGTLVDVVNNAHKRGLFSDIDEIRVMKDVRNTIAHEYIVDVYAEP